MRLKSERRAKVGSTSDESSNREAKLVEKPVPDERAKLEFKLGVMKLG